MSAYGWCGFDLVEGIPLVRRALKILNDREVSPQLGLLKSTLLQLDSTFSERDYSASTFRDFIEKMASAGYVNLKQVDRSLLVELKDGAVVDEEEPAPQPAAEATQAAAAAPAAPAQAPTHAPPPGGPSPAQVEEGVRALVEAFQNAKNPPHWPMYLRNVRQYVKNAAPSYDERRYGFANFLEAVRAAGRAGLFRLERNRQGILRIFAGGQFPHQAAGSAHGGVTEKPPIFDIENELAEQAAAAAAAAAAAQEEQEQEPIAEQEAVAEVEAEEAAVPEEVAVPVRRRKPAARTTSAKKKSAAPRKTKKKAADSEDDA